MKKYQTLFLTMLKIGLFTFGGGYAMIALLENEFVSRKKWIEKDEFLDMVAIAESTPGPIAINSATYIAVCIPSFFIIYVISLFFDAFLSLTLVSYAFKGIQVCVIYLIFSAGIKLLKGIKKTAFNISIICIVIASMVFNTLFAIKFSTVYYILIAGMVGIFAYFINNLKDRKEADK